MCHLSLWQEINLIQKLGDESVDDNVLPKAAQSLTA
jgi:hypothetical protein